MKDIRGKKAKNYARSSRDKPTYELIKAYAAGN